MLQASFIVYLIYILTSTRCHPAPCKTPAHNLYACTVTTSCDMKDANLLRDCHLCIIMVVSIVRVFFGTFEEYSLQ